MSKLLQPEQAGAIRASIAGRLPSTSFQSSDVLLQFGVEPDVLTIAVVIPEGSRTAGLLARTLLLRETPQSLTPLAGLVVDKVVRKPVIELMTLSYETVRARAVAAAQRPCKPDVAAGLLRAALDVAPRRAITTSGSGVAARLVESIPGIHGTEDGEQDGWTASILLVASIAFALAAASAPSVSGRLQRWARRTSSEYSECSALNNGGSAAVAINSSTAAQPRPAVDKARPQSFLALNGARLLAGIHIVLGHMSQSGFYGGNYAATWGFSWVPWFFMLSGYVLTLARHASKNPEAPQSVIAFVQKRAAVIYPPYVFALFLGLAQTWWEGGALPKFYHLAAQGVLAQSFVPWLPENSVQVCEPCTPWPRGGCEDMRSGCEQQRHRRRLFVRVCIRRMWMGWWRCVGLEPYACG
jgi:hypothetical protein